MIPPEHREAVDRAMREAFGDAPWTVAEALAGADGVGRALVYRVEVHGRPYLLRLTTNPGTQRELPYMRRAADAGVAPRVRFGEAGLLVSDWVDARPYPADPVGPLARTLAALHAMPGFPAEPPVLGLDAIIRRLPAAGLLPADQATALLAAYDRASAVPRPEADRVPCHNDLKPSNMLWDGARFWLVDWEAAFMNDRYNDVAIACNFVSPADPTPFLAAYLGAPPTAAQLERMRAAQVRVGTAYVAVFAGLAARGGAPWDPDLPAPDFAALQAGLVAGAHGLASPAAMRDYARAHLDRTLALDPRS